MNAKISKIIRSVLKNPTESNKFMKELITNRDKNRDEFTIEVSGKSIRIKRL